MTYDSQKYHRRPLRLTGYDYSQAGVYFITACAQDRVCLFGEVVGGQMHLNEAGRMVLAAWNSLPVRFPGVELDEFGIMPNHIHGIITISTETGGVTGPGGATTRVAPTGDANIGGMDRAAADIGAVDRAEVIGAIDPAAVAREPAASVIERTTELTGHVGATLVVALPDPVPGPATTAADTLAVGPGGATTRVAPTGDANIGGMDRAAVVVGAIDRHPILGDVVGAFKSVTTDLYIQAVKHSGWLSFRGRLWQRNYHEHVIRSERVLNRKKTA